MKLYHYIKQRRLKIVAVAIWLILWQVFSIIITRKYLLASPLEVIKAFLSLVGQSRFWISIGTSFIKISLGFLLAAMVGVGLAVGSIWNKLAREVISLGIRTIKSIPVASFIILILLWVRSENLSIVISFLTVLPIIYTNVLKGLEATDSKLLEMAEVFHVGGKKRFRYIYLPSVMPYFVSSCSIALGFCWKSGIAAEVIGLPLHSIGEQLYEAKLYLMTGELFAWTFVIIGISVLFESLVMMIIRVFEKRIRHY